MRTCHLLFLLLITLVFLPDTATAQGGDIRILRSIQENRKTNHDVFWQRTGLASRFISYATPTVLYTIAYLQNNQENRAKSWEMGMGLGINVVVTYGLKYSVGRSRPYQTFPDIIPDQYRNSPSFPSGHVSESFALLTSVCVNYPRLYYIAPVALMAGSVSYSRLHLGQHYPSDVLAGALCGVGSAFASRWINKQLKGKK